MERCIAHVDMNNFYASVECLYRPDIRNQAVAVGGDVEQRHGIILAKNQLAKRAGVQTGEALWQARARCPQLVIVPPNYPLYLRMSRYLRNILYSYSELVEPFGLDEAWLDITGSLHKYGSGEAIAQEIRQRVKDELGVTVSIGVSWNKIFAKLGSDMKKPDAVTVIERENFQEKVWPLPVGELLYVGRATQKKLAMMGIETIGGLAKTELKWLQLRFGKIGDVLYMFANGLDTSAVQPLGEEAVVKGVGNSTTTPRDLISMDDVNLVMYVLCESVAMRLAEQGLVGRTVQISLRDNGLFSFQRQGKLVRATALSGEIHDKAMELVQENYHFEKQPPLRSIGVRVTDLSSATDAQQLSLFEDETQRQKALLLEQAVFDTRRRFGNQSIRRAVLLSDTMGELNPKEETVIHPVSYFKSGPMPTKG